MSRKINFITLLHAKLLTGILLMLCPFLSSFSQSFQLKVFSTRDGLPSPYILGTFADQRGYMWISTVNGLSRFDGQHFTNYGYSDGLSNSMVGPMLMDSKQRLWIGTQNEMGQFIANRFHGYPLSDSLKKFSVNWFLETRDKNIWAATTGGVYEFNNGSWQKLALYPGYEDHSCRKIIETKDALYINYGNVVLVRKTGARYSAVTPLNAKAYYYFNLYQSGNDVLVTSIEGVLHIENDKAVRVPGALGNLKGIYAFFRDSRKRTWIGSDDGGLQMLPADSTARLITVYKTSQINLISGINEDEQGNIWVAGFEGLVKLYEPGYVIHPFIQPGSGKVIRNIIHLPGQPMLVNDGTLDLYTLNGNRFTRQQMQLEKRSVLPNNEFIIDNYCVDGKGIPWFCLRGFELAKVEGSVVHVEYEKYKRLGSESFDVMYDDYREKILTSVLTQPYPCQFDDTAFNPLPVKNKVDIQSIIRHIHQCTNKYILFSTEDGKVYSVDKNNFCKEQPVNNSNGSQVSWFLNDPSGDVWIGYNGISLRRYRWQKDILVLQEELDKTNGLLNDYVVGICFDNQQNFWVATLGGLTILSIHKENNRHSYYKTIRSFSIADLNEEISEASRLSKDREGNIWLSFPDKLMAFFPGKIIGEKSLLPGIQIEDVRINLQPTDWSGYTDTLTGVFGIPENPKLSYDKNNIGIYFNGISLSGTEGILYSYQLTGLSDNWSPASKTDLVSFVKLSPGKYVFSVKAKLISSDWSRPAVFAFEIKKPFWETWWFRLLMLAVASGIIILIFRYRLSQVRKKTEIKNQLTELEMKALKAQMNPHFIYNSLNSIQSLVANDKPREASHYISQFAKLLRQVLEQSDNNVIALHKELQTLELYISLESLRLNFEPKFSLRIAADIQPANEKLPPLILQPFIENALWHGLSRKEGEKKISLTIEATADWLSCIIEDNGIGRKKAGALKSASQDHEPRGMNITYRRLVDFNNNDNIQPVIFEDLYNDTGEPAGTKVTLKIRRMN